MGAMPTTFIAGEALITSAIMTLKEAQSTVDQWIKTYGVRYFSELTNMACLTEEVGELVAFLCDDRSAYINGNGILIAGGKVME